MTNWKRVGRLPEHDEASGSMTTLVDSTYEVEGIKFVRVSDYTTFRAEYGLKDGVNLVYHFFGTEEANKLGNPWHYWKKMFAIALQKIASEYFKTVPPYLRAAYSEELVSWWLQADGAANKTLDVDAYARKFLEKLDAELDRMIEETFGCTSS